MTPKVLQDNLHVDYVIKYKVPLDGMISHWIHTGSTDQV